MFVLWFRISHGHFGGSRSWHGTATKRAGSNGACRVGLLMAVELLVVLVLYAMVIMVMAFGACFGVCNRGTGGVGGDYAFCSGGDGAGWSGVASADR